MLHAIIRYALHGAVTVQRILSQPPILKSFVSCETVSIFRAIEKRERYFLNVPVFCFILHYAAAMVASIWS